MAVKVQTQNFDFLIDPSFRGLKRLFVLSFTNVDDRAGHKKLSLPTKEIKDYNAMVNGRKAFDQCVRNDTRTDEYIKKIAISQVHNYTTVCLLNYWYFNEL